MNLVTLLVLSQLQFYTSSGQKIGAPATRAICGTNVTCTPQGALGVTLECSGGGGGAPTSATYITQTPNASLSNEQALSALGTGLMLNATGTGVVSIYAGSSCSASKWAVSTDATGALTCEQPAFTDISGTVSDAQLASNYSGVGACPANQYANTLNDNAAPSCSQVSYAQVSGAPTLYNQTIQDEGSSLTQRSTVNFTGSGVSCTDSGGKTVCTVSGGGGGGLTAGEAQRLVAIGGP